jgi:hypothetical protein
LPFAFLRPEGPRFRLFVALALFSRDRLVHHWASLELIGLEFIRRGAEG